MDSPQIAVLTVSLSEWNETKALIKEIGENLKALTSKNQKELLTPNEVCEMLKIGRTTYERYVNNGVLEVKRINKKKYSKTYVSRSHLEKLIKEGTI